MSNLKPIANFLFEVGLLSRTPRSYTSLLGSGSQSVSEHITRVLYAGFVLASMEENIDTEKVLKMCLIHDLAEARMSDLNYVHQKYVQRNEEKALQELTSELPFGGEITSLMQEFEARKTKEAIIAKDADQIEFILSLKEQIDIGNTRAETWLPSTVKRLKTDSAKKLVEQILDTSSDEWWFGNKDDEWWVTRNMPTETETKK